MIAIQAENGELIKVLKDALEGEFGFHRSFGLISKSRAAERSKMKKRQHYDYTGDQWLCSFNIQGASNSFTLSPIFGCEVSEVSGGWQLKTPVGTFTLSSHAPAHLPSILESSSLDSKPTNPLTSFWGLTFLFAVLFIPLLYWQSQRSHEVASSSLGQEENLEPITVQMVKEPETVKIENPFAATSADREVTQNEKIRKNLGFLGAWASADVKNATNGAAPTQLKAVGSGGETVGTGAHRGIGSGTGTGIGAGDSAGHASAGGELLAGFGKGLKKAAIGNGGVQGLGGIGTKGNGGGNGGYGRSLVAGSGGEGKGIAAIAVSKSDMVLEGGINRYAINATIAKYTNQVRRCYESELKNHPELQGLVEMSFEINAEGKLNYSKVKKSTLNNPAVESCISTKMMDWQFPKPKGGVNVDVTYPFLLRPVGA